MAIVSEEEKGNLGHSVLGASAAHRWMNCPGSIQLSEKAGSESTNYAAAEGTAAHTVLEQCLVGGHEAWEFSGEKIQVEDWTFTVDEEMVNAVQTSLDYVEEVVANTGMASVHAELPLRSETHKQAFGTADVVSVPGKTDPGVTNVFDFKYGAGIPVSPDSVQNHYYGYLVVETFELLDTDVVRLHIMQPRIPHADGIHRCHWTTAGELRMWWHEDVLPAMKATAENDPVFQTGDHCRFCPAKAICPALKKEVDSVDTGSPVETLDSRDIRELLDRLERLESYHKALKEEALKRVTSGETVPGMKPVRKKSNRTWREGSEQALREKFDQDALNVSLKTPPQVEKLPGGRDFAAEWAYKPDTGITLAKDEDPRPENMSPMENFLENGQTKD